MSETLVWWLMLQVVALASLPLCLTLFRRLPDRGYTMSKAFGLLLLGYLFWILNVMHILPNSTTGIIWVLIPLFAVSGFVGWRRREELLEFWRERWWLIYAAEALLFVAFITAAYLRSFTPDIGGTEKPMDFMFLNAVTRGDHFPPPDAWLSGSNVSYYYFGYLLVSIMTRLSGVATSVGFNLGLAMIAALGLTGAFGLVFNLAAPHERRAAEGGPGTPAAQFDSRPLWRPMIFGLAAGLFLVVMGNLEGALEWLAAKDMGSAGFWSWAHLDAQDPVVPYDSAHWFPDKFWFWWRATRLLDGGVGIHEFPFFSFLLGDLHPHVMSIPFVLLAIGMALAVFRSDEPLDLVVWLERPLTLVVFALILGALAFLNTWDMPTMAFVFTLAALLRNRLHADRWSWGLAIDTGGFVLPLFIVAFLAYSPFFFGGFTSQAAGFTAESGSGSGLFHSFLIWGPFAVLVLPYAAWRIYQSDQPITRRAVLWSLAPAATVLVLWVVWDLFAANRNANDINIINKGFGLNALLGWLPNQLLPNNGKQGVWDAIGDRGWNWLTVIAMAGALGLLVLALAREVEDAKRTGEERFGHIMALVLSTTAALLILGVEFLYIEDGFDSRMNTIFKLYYQSWLLLSVAGGFALYEVARTWRMPRFDVSLRSIWIGGLAVVLLGAFVYPLLATWNRTEGCVGHPVRLLQAGNCGDVYGRRSIDGLEFLKSNNPGEYEAILWLADRDGQPVIAEAVGDDYSPGGGGRVSAATGLPTPLQWPGHELQWRGTSSPQAGRREDVDLLYTSRDPAEVRGVIEKYGIVFIFVGGLERETYPDLALPDMIDIVEPAKTAGDTIVYRVKPQVLSGVAQE